ncbi:MAG: cyclic nucleotide-binding domain-containing protein [Myxococcota bacterium]|nr:cyclic nucleotide-binding domain-containing protein [Myxococcota bacterium]
MSAAQLKTFTLFADLGDAEREDLAELLEERELSARETLFGEGDEADALVLVLSGCVEIESPRSGERLSIGPGGAIGALALFSVGLREGAAVGVAESDLRLLRREDFLRFAEDHPRAAFRIAAAVAAEVAQHARAALSQRSVSVDPSRPAE